MKHINIVFSVVFVFFIFITIALIIPQTQGRSYLLNTESSISTSSDSSSFGILNYNEESQPIKITIIYEYGRFARPQGFPFPNRKIPTTINLSIAEKPSWCSIRLENTSFEAAIDGFLKGNIITFITNITATIISESTPAFTNDIITLQVSAAQNGNIGNSSDLIKFSIQPEFIASIDYLISDPMIYLEPNEGKIIYITVKNTGNAKILAKIFSNSSENEHIKITFPKENSIDLDEEEIFPIIIKSKKTESDRVTQDITFNISYHASVDSSDVGTPVTIPMTIQINGSEENISTIDLLPFVIGVVIVFIILYILFTTVAWRRQHNY